MVYKELCLIILLVGIAYCINMQPIGSTNSNPATVNIVNVPDIGNSNVNTSSTNGNTGSSNTASTHTNQVSGVDITNWKQLLMTLQKLPIFQQSTYYPAQQQPTVHQQSQQMPSYQVNPVIGGSSLFPPANMPVPASTVNSQNNLGNNHKSTATYLHSHQQPYSNQMPYIGQYKVQQTVQNYHYVVSNHISYFEKTHLLPSYGLDEEQKYKLLEEHNKYRVEHSGSAANINALRWSERLAEKAFNETDGCAYVNKGNGATLGMVHEKKTGTSTVSEILGRWADEKKYFLAPGYNCPLSNSCRYTQVIWAKSKEVGCAARTCSDMIFVVCMYDPVGNIENQPAYIEGTPCSMCEAPPGKPPRCNSERLCEWYP